jgi:hypothetical protein
MFLVSALEVSGQLCTFVTLPLGQVAEMSICQHIAGPKPELN